MDTAAASVEVVVCSTSGKPIFHYARRSRASASDAGPNSAALASSLQGLLAFVACTQHEQLRELQAPGLRAFFRTTGPLSLAVVLRPLAAPAVGSRSCIRTDESNSWDRNPASDVARECLQRLTDLLLAQILFVLTDRGLDVLRRQPGYDLRELLRGTERVMAALCARWASEPALRFRGLGVPFVRLAAAQRLAVSRALESEPPVLSSGSSSPSHATMICGMLLARKQVVAVAQPNRKRFGILVDDLLLVINFVYNTPSLAKAETWTPICLPSFNASGFLYAYVVFLTADICLLLLSSQQSPEQFHAFHAKKAVVAQRLEAIGALAAIAAALENHSAWRPHVDLPLLTHFIYKNELTGECATPEPAFPFASPALSNSSDTSGAATAASEDTGDADAAMQLLNQYAKLHHIMYPSEMESSSSGGGSGDSADVGPRSGNTNAKSQALGSRTPGLHDAVASRLTFARSDSGLFVGTCTDEYRLYACFDSLASVTEAKEQCELLVERLRRDDTLTSPPHFAPGFGSQTPSLLWP